MTKRRPGDRAARGKKRLESGAGARTLVAQLSRRNPIAPKPWSTWCDPDLDDETRSDLCRLWWHLHRHGVRLPPERGVILIRGGR